MLTTVLVADDGKVFRRIFDNEIVGNVVHLGYVHYVRGVKLDVPLLDKAEYYVEIDAPIIEEISNTIE